MTTPSVSELLARAIEISDCCAAHAGVVDAEARFPAEEFGWIAEAGLLAAPLAPALGGPGLGSVPGQTADLLTLLRHIGRGSLPVGRVYEGHINALLLVQTFGTPEQQARWAADARDDKRLFSVWNTEGADGVKLCPLPDGRCRIEGAKTFASGAHFVTRPLISGTLPDGGWQMLILPTERLPKAEADPSFWKPLGMRPTASVHMDFTGLEVGPEDLLGAPGDYYQQPAFSGGGIRFMAVQLGGAQAILVATRDFLRGLGRTGDAFQRDRAGRMAMLIESGRLWLDAAGAFVDRPGVTPDAVIAYTGQARAVVEEACLEVMRLAEKSVGARGLLCPLPLERMHRDLTLYLRQGGADAALPEAGRYVLESPRPVDRLWEDSPLAPNNGGTGEDVGEASASSVPAPPLLGAGGASLWQTDGLLADAAALPLRPAGAVAEWGRTVVIAPHPDDDTLGCGGAIALMAERGQPVSVLFVSDGAASHPGSVKFPPPVLRDLREAESREALRRLGVGEDAAVFLRLPDGALPLPGAAAFDAAVYAVGSALAELKPDTILLPWRRDPHPDHRATSAIVQAALQGMAHPPRVLEYPIWAWERADTNALPKQGEVEPFRLDINATVDQKTQAVAAHESQVTRLVDDAPEFCLLAPEMLAKFAQPWEVYLEVIAW